MCGTSAQLCVLRRREADGRRRRAVCTARDHHVDDMPTPLSSSSFPPQALPARPLVLPPHTLLSPSPLTPLQFRNALQHCNRQCQSLTSGEKGTHHRSNVSSSNIFLLSPSAV